MQTHHERDDLDVRTALDVLGVSRQRETLRFRQLGNHASKIDLSSYLIEARKRGLSLSLGHINYGNNRHLLNSMDSGGLIAKYELGNRFDLSLNSMNGRQIVGYSNFAGLSDLSDNNVSAGTLGVNLLKGTTGDVRFEGMLMRGRLQPELGFNVGEVVDAEQNCGFGLRLFGSGVGGRLRGDFSFARSRYDNPHVRCKSPNVRGRWI